MRMHSVAEQNLGGSLLGGLDTNNVSNRCIVAPSSVDTDVGRFLQGGGFGPEIRAWVTT